MCWDVKGNGWRVHGGQRRKPYGSDVLQDLCLVEDRDEEWNQSHGTHERQLRGSLQKLYSLGLTVVLWDSVLSFGGRRIVSVWIHLQD